MITREEYLKAVEAVTQYHRQLESIIEKHEFRNADKRVGDTIVFDRSMSNKITIGKHYKILWVSGKGDRKFFEITLDDGKRKRMGHYTQGSSWRIVDRNMYPSTLPS